MKLGRRGSLRCNVMERNQARENVKLSVLSGSMNCAR